MATPTTKVNNSVYRIGFKKISFVSVDKQGNEITLCAKDIIL